MSRYAIYTDSQFWANDLAGSELGSSMFARLVTRKFEEEVYLQTCINGKKT